MLKLATRSRVKRSMLLAVESQRRAARAVIEGRFRSQIIPVQVPSRKGPVIFEVDGHVRADVTMEQLAKMKPVLKGDGGVTPGNASGINNGAAAVVLVSGEKVRALGLKPLARLVSYAHAGVDPAYTGMGPVPATAQALKRAGLKISQLDVIEPNEAFTAQACAVVRELKLDPAKVNPNGSGISLGHPVGATGAIITTKAFTTCTASVGAMLSLPCALAAGRVSPRSLNVPEGVL